MLKAGELVFAGTVDWYHINFKFYRLTELYCRKLKKKSSVSFQTKLTFNNV